MAVTTSAKRGEARGAASPPSHIKREVIGVVLIALALLTLLSLLSFVPGELKAGAAATPPLQKPHRVGRRVLSLLPYSGRSAGPPTCFPFSSVSWVSAVSLRATCRSVCGTPAHRWRHCCFSVACFHLEIMAVPTVSSGLIYRGMAGGFFGQVLAESLRAYFASTGAHILIMAGLLVSLLFTTPISLSEMARRLPGLGQLDVQQGAYLDSGPAGGRSRF